MGGKTVGFLSSVFNKNNKVRANCKLENLKMTELPNNEGYVEEFSEDISGVIHNNDIVSCSNNGVMLFDIPNMLKLVYTGELAKKDAEEIYAVIGYGDNDQWQESGEFKMNRTAHQTFELLTFKKKEGNINIAFRDGAGNWDNNSGQNYIFFFEESGQNNN